MADFSDYFAGFLTLPQECPLGVICRHQPWSKRCPLMATGGHSHLGWRRSDSSLVPGIGTLSRVGLRDAEVCRPGR